MRARTVATFAVVAIAAAAAGLYFGTWRTQSKLPFVRASDAKSLPELTFEDANGKPHTLADFRGKFVLLNIWATWCAPCREEMPAFAQLQRRWAARGVQFVGVSSEEAAKVARFGRELGINYPLWVGEAAPELSRRLGNTGGVLPHSVVLDGSGKVLEQRVGPYRDWELDAILGKYAGKSV